MINFESLRKKAFLYLYKIAVDTISELLSQPKKGQQMWVEDRTCNAGVHALNLTSVDAAVAAATNRFFTLNKHLKSPPGFS